MPFFFFLLMFGVFFACLLSSGGKGLSDGGFKTVLYLHMLPSVW